MRNKVTSRIGLQKGRKFRVPSADNRVQCSHGSTFLLPEVPQFFFDQLQCLAFGIYACHVSHHRTALQIHKAFDCNNGFGKAGSNQLEAPFGLRQGLLRKPNLKRL